jgi:hypothetical protein
MKCISCAGFSIPLMAIKYNPGKNPRNLLYFNRPLYKYNSIGYRYLLCGVGMFEVFPLEAPGELKKLSREGEKQVPDEILAV